MYITNPHLRMNIVEVLRYFLPDMTKRRAGSVASSGSSDVSLVQIDLLYTNEFAKKFLIPALVNFYIDVEHTGSHTQFYDKFKARMDIGDILEYFWSNNDHYKTAIISFCNSLPERFLRFINAIVTDAIFHLDESFKHLAEIKTFEMEMANTTEWNAQNPQTRQEREQYFATIQDRCKSDCLLANKKIHLLHLLTSQIKKPFMAPEILEKLVTMLNYFLVKLAGPEGLQLKVHDPAKYNFDPRQLLIEIVEIYIHLEGKEFPEFYLAIANDGRSYKPNIFAKVPNTLRGKLNYNEANIISFAQLTQKVPEVAKIQKEQEDDTEVPDEFLDPLLFQVMKDPVNLPSGQIVDRDTISRHLLNDPTNPFTRAHLTMEMIVPNPELKIKIEEWQKSRIEKKKQKKCK